MRRGSKNNYHDIRNCTCEAFEEYQTKKINIAFTNIWAIYAEIASAFFRLHNLTKAAFMAKILGHSKEYLQTANSHMKFYMPEVTKADVAQGIKTRFMKRLQTYYCETKEEYPKSL